MDNVSLFFLIFNLSHHFIILDKLMFFITEYVIYLSLILMLVLAYKGSKSEKKALILAIFAIPIAVLLIKGIHLFYFEPRPFLTYNFIPLTDNIEGASFPSRHASIMGVVAFSYTYFGSKWSALFLPLMLLVGLSRIYVGVHYPLDILGGFGVAAISLIITLQIKNLILSS